MTGSPTPPNGIGFRVDTWIDHGRQFEDLHRGRVNLDRGAGVAMFLAERLSGNGRVARGVDPTPLRLTYWRSPKTWSSTWHDCRRQPNGASLPRFGHSATP